jgi:IS605 OrfB family transposase
MLGVRLAKPPANKMALRVQQDQHGVYETFREPVDFVVIEDLSRYRTTQGKSPQENGRLMKWCHRAVRDKLHQLCEPFGIPVLEVPPAYSSQFCARSGVIGFRAEDVTAGFETRAPWCFRLRVKDGEEESTEQRELRQLAAGLHEAQMTMEKQWREKHGSGEPPKVTILLPKQGGQIFIPIVAADADGNRLDARVLDADLNAAVNVGLRAVADPRMWEFFPRLRTVRISGELRYKGRKGKKTKAQAGTSAINDEKPVEEKIALRAREKRKYGETGPELDLGEPPSGSAARETRQPNYFRDFAAIAVWDKAWLDDPVVSRRVELVSAKSLFKSMRERQWSRCVQINSARLAKWIK